MQHVHKKGTKVERPAGSARTQNESAAQMTSTNSNSRNLYCTPTRRSRILSIDDFETLHHRRRKERLERQQQQHKTKPSESNRQKPNLMIDPNSPPSNLPTYSPAQYASPTASSRAKVDSNNRRKQAWGHTDKPATCPSVFRPFLERTMAKEHERQVRLQQKRQRLACEEMLHCTFRPASHHGPQQQLITAMTPTSHSVSAVKASRTMYEEAVRAKQINEARVKQALQLKEEQELSECTFMPKTGRIGGNTTKQAASVEAARQVTLHVRRWMKQSIGGQDQSQSARCDTCVARKAETRVERIRVANKRPPKPAQPFTSTLAKHQAKRENEVARSRRNSKRSQFSAAALIPKSKDVELQMQLRCLLKETISPISPESSVLKAYHERRLAAKNGNITELEKNTGANEHFLSRLTECATDKYANHSYTMSSYTKVVDDQDYTSEMQTAVQKMKDLLG